MKISTKIKIALQTIFLVFVLIFGFLGKSIAADYAEIEISSVDTLTDYELYSELFFEMESASVSEELKPLEKYLTFLLESVNYQVKKHKQLKSSDLEALSDEAITRLALNISSSEAPNVFANKYEIWKKFQLNELFLNIDRALRLKRTIWSLSTAEERQKMFRRDLKTALGFYQKKDYATAVHIFRHLIDFYGYQNVDDIKFYLSEAHYILGQEQIAMEGYLEIIEDFPTSSFYEVSLYRYMTLNYFREQYPDVHRVFDFFIQRFNRKITDENGNQIPGWSYEADVLNFLMGCVYYREEDYSNALRQYESLPPESEYYGRAEYLAAHCLLRLERKDEAMEILHSILRGSVSVYPEVWFETAIMVGDIKLEQGQPNIAWGYYALVDETSPLYPRAMVGMGLIRLQREEYDIALELANEVIESYPISNYLYQARCLRGASLRKLDRIVQATEEYDHILTDSMKKINLVNFLTERLKISYLLKCLIEWEEEVIASGDEDLFNRYWLLRSNTTDLLERAYYTEYTELLPDFQQYIDERLTFNALFTDFRRLSLRAEVLPSNRLRLRCSQMAKKLQKIDNKIWTAGIVKLQELPYYYWNEEKRFQDEALDSLYNVTIEELKQAEAELIAIARAFRISPDEIDSQRGAELLQRAYETRHWRESLDSQITTEIYQDNPRPELDLSRWSHIAFHKYLIPGTDFNDLKAEQKRVKDVDKYLQALDEITYNLGISISQ